VVCGV